MGLSVGIVGLPNVGKSTLFNALLKKQQAYVANFPFATIEPNVGVVPVPDERLGKLADVIATPGEPGLTPGVSRPPVVPATVEFLDIAGLIAYVLDKIDGNMFFHYTLAKWVAAGNGERKIPSVAALEFTFKQRNQFTQALERAKALFPGAVDCCQFLLDYQIKYMVEAWRDVPENKRPQIINEQLQNMLK